MGLRGFWQVRRGFKEGFRFQEGSGIPRSATKESKKEGGMVREVVVVAGEGAYMFLFWDPRRRPGQPLKLLGEEGES